MVGRLDAHAVIRALCIQRTLRHSRNLRVLRACRRVGIILLDGSLQTLGIDAQLLGQLFKGRALGIVAQTHMLADTVEGIIAGLVGDVVGRAIRLFLNHGAAIHAGLVRQERTLVVGQQVHVRAAGQIAIRHDDVGEEAHLAHVLHLETILLEDLHEVARRAHLVRGIKHLVARRILGKQLLVGAEAAGCDNGALGIDGIRLVRVVGNDHALADAIFHHEIHALGAGAHIHAQLSRSLLQARLNNLAGILVILGHVVGAAIVVIQLDTHCAQPRVNAVFLVRPNLNALGRFTVGALFLDELRQTGLADPLVVARGLLSLGVDHVEEVHVELAVAAENIQLFNDDDVLIRIGLLGADRRSQTRRAAADDHDVAFLGRALGRRLLGVLHGNGRRFQTGLLHRISHGSLDRVRREGRGRHAVHIRRIRFKNALADHRERTVDDNVRLVVVAQRHIGDGAVLDGHVHGHFAVIAVARRRIGLGHRHTARHHGGRSQQAEHLDFVHCSSSLTLWAKKRPEAAFTSAKV